MTAVELVTEDAAFEALAPEWRDLHARTGVRNPFLSWAWTSACRSHIRPAAGLFVLIARDDDGRLVGVAPLCLERSLGFRALRFIADGRSDYLGFLADPEVPGTALRLLEGMAERSHLWDVAVLRHLTSDDSVIAATEMPAGLRAHEIEGTVAAHLEFAGEWEELTSRAAPVPGVRRSVRWVKRFAKRGGEVVRVTGPEALARLDDICAIEARSWKGRGGTARFQPGPGRELLRSALEHVPEEDMEVWLAQVDGRPIAFQINFLAPGRLLYYQGAYDEEQRSHYAGGVLHHHAFARAWADGRREYDFMAGDEGYKGDWTNRARSLRYLAIHPTSLRGRAAYGVLVAPRWWLKRSRLARWAHHRLVLLRGRLGR